MTQPRAGPSGGSASTLEEEHVPWLALLPVVATITVYLLPHPIHHYTFVHIVPQLVAYFAFTCWAQLNRHFIARLGLEWPKVREGCRIGLRVGVLLGTVNVFVILVLVPHLGRDITFLQETPHAKVPTWIMVPWLIVLIAVFVEVNFRGFVLGRLLLLARRCSPGHAPEWGQFLALLTSAILFAFDPFLVATFRHLHWIALWDGLVWGALWIRRRNLYIPIVAHGIEVVILYSVVRTWLER